MHSAVIYFSDKTSLVLHEDDLITPIILCPSNDVPQAAMGPSVKIEYHIHNELIPSIMDALCTCNFFYINQKFDVAYSSHAIVRIETS